MLTYYKQGLVLLLVLFAASCKKDLLHWQKVQQLNSGTTSRINHITFLGSDICVTGGGLQFDKAEVLRSVDGGYTWSSRSYPEAGKGMYGMCVTQWGNIYMCGTDGTVLHSADSGASFQFGRIGTWAFFVGASFPTPDTGIFISSILQRGGAITRIDSGFHIIDNQEFIFGLNDIYMTSSTLGYVVGYGAVMKTTDRGNTWNYQDPIDDNFTAMDIHGDEIWMCGANGCIYHTLDGGNHWQQYRNGNSLALPHYGLRCILFKDEHNGWAAGDGGKLIRTDDGGQHWAEYDQFTNSTIRSLAICPNGDLLAAGDEGILFRLTTL